MGMFKENKGFVQGVAWDPLQKYVATLSSDRFDSFVSISYNTEC